MNSPCREIQDRLIEGALAAEPADRELAVHLAHCPGCTAHFARAQRLAHVLVGLPRHSAPIELDGRAVAACEAGFRQERVVGEIFGLARTGAPSELEARLLGPGGALRRTAPPVLERLVDEDLHDPKKAIARRYGARLRRVSAPESLRERVASAIARGFAPESRGVRRQFAAALAVFVLALGAALWWRAHEVARSTHDAEFAVTEVRSIDELDPFAKALFGGLTGGVSEIVGKEQRVRPEGAALNAPNNPSAAHDPTPSVTPNATMPSTASPSTASPAAIPGLVPATRTKSAAPASMDGRSMDGSSGPNTSVQARLPLVERMASAPLTVAFKGQRHVLLAYTLAGVPQTLDYTEEVYADGLGHFAIDPLTLASPPMTTAEAQLFALTQKLREGFLYRMRDFNVRDAQLFLANYMLQDLAAGAVIAGRTCVELRATLQQNATSSFLIDVDPITALVMRVRETANDGTDLGTTEFISFTLNPDLTGALYHTDLPATPLDISPGTNTVPQIGFSVWAPQTVPSGYAFVSAENVDDGLGHHWARMTYGDGARQVFCLHTVLPPAMVGGGVPDGLQTAMWVGQRTAKVFRAGPWTIAQGFFGLNEFIAVGKCDKSLLLSMIKSAVH